MKFESILEFSTQFDVKNLISMYMTVTVRSKDILTLTTLLLIKSMKKENIHMIITAI